MSTAPLYVLGNLVADSARGTFSDGWLQPPVTQYSFWTTSNGVLLGRPNLSYISSALPGNIDMATAAGDTLRRLEAAAAQKRVMASIMLGIEQAARNEGTILGDADLTTDEDEE